MRVHALLAGDPEAEVFRAKDERARKLLEQEEAPRATDKQRRRSPYPSGPGEPIPEG